MGETRRMARLPHMFMASGTRKPFEQQGMHSRSSTCSRVLPASQRLGAAAAGTLKPKPTSSVSGTAPAPAKGAARAARRGWMLQPGCMVHGHQRSSTHARTHGHALQRPPVAGLEAAAHPHARTCDLCRPPYAPALREARCLKGRALLVKGRGAHGGRLLLWVLWVALLGFRARGASAHAGCLLRHFWELGGGGRALPSVTARKKSSCLGPLPRLLLPPFLSPPWSRAVLFAPCLRGATRNRKLLIPHPV